LSVLLSAVTNSAIIDLNCRGESSGALLACGKTDIGPVVGAVSSARAATGTGIIKVVPGTTLLIDEAEPF
jgi:hypothetical protein